MGYFMDYEHTKCWHCGRTDCTGNHPEASRKRDNELHAQHGGGGNCPCNFCTERRQNQRRRGTK